MPILTLPLVLLAALATTPALAQPAPSPAAVEANLLPAVVIDTSALPPETTPPETWTLQARMAKWNVPGVSVAVIDDGKVVWARGYGVLAVGETAPVTPTTRFQAASISKPVAAVAALSLVQDGALSLDGDVNGALKSWKLPASDFTKGHPVTLRALLSHTGGTTVHGFPGYAQGAAVPTLVEVLSGTAPANTPAVVSEAAPGARWRYSGGGYEIVQLMIEEATGKPFAQVVQNRVLTPAGMDHSGYAAPAAGAFAKGHGLDGKLIPGGWHSYPEAAAAGLWTTPTDLARFGLALADAQRGRPGAILSPAMIKAMTTEVAGGYGLGPGVAGQGETLALSHGGANEGFRAFWVIHPATGDGVVVMTNSDAGAPVMMEIVRSVARVYGWPDYGQDRYTAVVLPAAVKAARAGVWTTTYEGQKLDFTLTWQGERLRATTPRDDFLFTAVGPDDMVAETGSKVTFAPAADGTLQLQAFGLVLTKED
jgi:CubicO group peptidase (beta-lactamase class C family)